MTLGFLNDIFIFLKNLLFSCRLSPLSLSHAVSLSQSHLLSPFFSISVFLSLPLLLGPSSRSSQASVFPCLTHYMGGWCWAGRRVSSTCSGPVRPTGFPRRPKYPEPLGSACAFVSSPPWPNDSFPQNP